MLSIQNNKLIKILSQADKISKDTLVKTSASQNQNTSIQGYMVIKEWGVKIPTNNIKGLYYGLGSDNFGINIRSSILDGFSKGCKTNSVSFERGKANDKYVGEVGPGDTFKKVYETSKDNVGPNEVNVLVGDYYYISGPPGASCVDLPYDDPQGAKLQQQEADEISAIARAVNQMAAL